MHVTCDIGVTPVEVGKKRWRTLVASAGKVG